MEPKGDSWDVNSLLVSIHSTCKRRSLAQSREAETDERQRSQEPSLGSLERSFQGRRGLNARAGGCQVWRMLEGTEDGGAM